MDIYYNMDIYHNNIKNLFISDNKNYKEEISETEYIYHDLIKLRKEIVIKINSNDILYNHRIFKNILSNTLCDFIINESEKYASNNMNEINKDGWTRTRHKNYPTTDLPISNISNISNLVKNIVVYDIFPLIESVYKVNKYFLDCNDIFIVKYKDNEQNKLERHKDGSAFSFNILLNSENNFEGGGTIINEEGKDILVHNTKGSLILHSGQVFHSGNIITKGVRYILVGFISYLKNYHLINNTEYNYNHEIESDCDLQNYQIDISNTYYNDIYNFIKNKEKKYSKSFLLNTQKTEFSLIEKIIYELFIFQLKKLNLDINFTRYKVEFWWKSQEINNNSKIVHNLHSDKDEKLMKSYNILICPILSTVTYINDSIHPTLLTSTNENKFMKENLINLKNGITLSFPKKLKHISFDGSNIHGALNLFNETLVNSEDRMTLMFNIWDSHTPLDIEYYDPDNKANNIEKINILENILKVDEIDIGSKLKIKLEDNEMKNILTALFRNPININNYLSKFRNLLNSTKSDIVEFNI